MKHFTQVMNENVVQEYGDNRITSRLELQDGTVLSIQAPGFHYCDPKRQRKFRTTLGMRVLK